MRPIEKRLDALEARSLPASRSNLALRFLPRGVDPAAFRQACRTEVGSDRFLVVRFVRPGEAAP